MQENDLVQSARLYVFMGGKLRWIKTAEIFEKMGLDWQKKRVYLDDEEIKKLEGKPITEWPEPEESPVEIRKWAIAGTCMDRPDWYDALKEMKFTHTHFNWACWLDTDRLASLGIKAIINITGENEDEWKAVIEGWKDLEVCGGYWLDDAGHEPDITRKSEAYENWRYRLELRKRFYQVVRELDIDIQNHPVVEIMDNTATGDFPEGHPGWGLTFSEETHNLLLVDIYPDYSNLNDKPKMIADMEESWNRFIKVYPHQHQVIIQMIANGSNYWPGYVWTQYEFWKEKLASPEFQNLYRGQIGTCFYKQELWMKSQGIQNEIKEVNADMVK